MDKVHKPQGLIRYDSLNGVNSGTKLKFTKRIAAYSSVLVLIASILIFMLVTRRNWESTLLRTPGMTYQYDEKTHIVGNLYQLRILNKSMQSQEFQVSVDAPLKLVWVGNGIQQVSQGQMAKGEFFIQARTGTWKQGEKVHVKIRSSEGKEEHLKTSFIQPDE